MRFAKARPTQQSEVSESLSWTEMALSGTEWSEALKDLETAFETWASDAEKWLVQSKFLQDNNPEKILAEGPKLLSGSHRMGALQSLEER